jgi:hypothetical protein
MLTILSKQTVILQDIQHSTHLTETKDTRSFLLQIRQQLVEDNHLSRVLDGMFVGGVRRTRFGTVEQVGVTGDFAKLRVE